MKILIFDPIGGASGDMILGSLIHFGCPVSHLKKTFDSLGIGKYAIKTSPKKINGIEAIDLKFDIPKTDTPRDYSQIKKLITKAKISKSTKESSLAIFEALAHAEGEVHGVKVNDVHFHEIGCLDSILDIVGIAAAIEWLNIDKIYTRPVPLGSGMTKSMHGIIPVPSPATIKLVEGLNVRITDIEGELTTPTGAAVLMALQEKGSAPSDLIILGSGYGCGDRTYKDWPNLFRSILCDVPEEKKDQIYVIETDIDDMIPEEWEGVREALFEKGALDVSLTQKIMKKGRPGVGLTIICASSLLDTLIDAVLTHTSSIGVRYYPVQRKILERKEFSIKTKYGIVKIKEVVRPDKKKTYKPEYKDMLKISTEKKVGILVLKAEVNKAMKKREGK
jgi:uncharacterized protein (TIGR00299 family) protein